MRHVLVMLVVLVALAGCGLTKSLADRREGWKADCLVYGFKLGTDPFANCMMEQEANHKQRMQKMRSDFAGAFKHLGDDLQKRPPRPVICNTSGSAYQTGSYTNYGSTTTCF